MGNMGIWEYKKNTGNYIAIKINAVTNCNNYCPLRDENS